MKKELMSIVRVDGAHFYANLFTQKDAFVILVHFYGFLPFNLAVVLLQITTTTALCISPKINKNPKLFHIILYFYGSHNDPEGPSSRT